MKLAILSQALLTFVISVTANAGLLSGDTVYVRQTMNQYEEQGRSRSVGPATCPPFIRISPSALAPQNIEIDLLSDYHSQLRNILFAVGDYKKPACQVTLGSTPNVLLHSTPFSLPPKFVRDFGTNDSDFPAKTIKTLLTTQTQNEIVIRDIYVKKLVANLKETEHLTRISETETGINLETFRSDDHSSVLTQKSYAVTLQCSYVRERIQATNCK